MYEAIIKVRVEDDPAKRRRDIEEGFGYAVAILMDEYGATADEVQSLLEREIDNAHDNEASRV